MASNHGWTPVQVLLAFVLAQKQMIAILRTSKVIHMKELLAVCNDLLTTDEYRAVDKAFPTPDHEVPLDIQ